MRTSFVGKGVDNYQLSRQVYHGTENEQRRAGARRFCHVSFS